MNICIITLPNLTNSNQKISLRIGEYIGIDLQTEDEKDIGNWITLNNKICAKK